LWIKALGYAKDACKSQARSGTVPVPIIKSGKRDCEGGDAPGDWPLNAGGWAISKLKG
jgi:hypothetical protein